VARSFERVADGYRAALDHFVDALRNHGPMGPNVAEALTAQAIAEAATKSLTSGRLEPVDYPVPLTH
jgi:myo-inositol 2-dehydrogenase/D-chiro-inositol 1-dehydrogenase